MTQDFETYLQQARTEFCLVAHKYNVREHNELRTAIDSLLIAYDQAFLALRKHGVVRPASESAAGGETFICPCCGSDKTYKTEAYHCNRCAITTEV